MESKALMMIDAIELPSRGSTLRLRDDRQREPSSTARQIRRRLLLDGAPRCQGGHQPDGE
jgi:hypothetical protein